MATNEAALPDFFTDWISEIVAEHGEERISPGDEAWAVEWLDSVLLGGERLCAHISLLEQSYKGKFRRFASRRDRKADEPILPNGPDRAFSHHTWLNEEQIAALAEHGPLALHDPQIFPEGFALAAARLLLNPYVLWHLSDLIQCRLPPYWLEQMERHDHLLAAELGMDLSVRTPLTSMLDEPSGKA